MFSENGLWKANSTERRPDIFTVQLGLHTCYHALPPKNLLYSNHTLINSHIQDISKLYRSIRTAIERPGENRTAMVIVVTSGAIGMENGVRADQCILRFNRVAAEEAHKHGFAVLERGEIERRLMYKSTLSDNPLLSTELHLSQPAQAVIATCLLKMITCLDAQNYDVYSSEIPSFMGIKANTQPSGYSADYFVESPKA